MAVADVVDLRSGHGRDQSLWIALPIAIRRAREADLTGLDWGDRRIGQREILRAAFDRQLLGDLDMLLALANGHPVGQVWIDYRQMDSDDGASLWAIRVLAPLRGLGIGGALLREAEARALRRGAHTLSLTVERRNTDALRLYERAGFHNATAAVIDDGRAPGLPSTRLLRSQWLMRKALRRDA